MPRTPVKYTVRERPLAAPELPFARTHALRFGVMERPGQFAHFRFVGDKRSQVVYDVDNLDDSAAPIIEELMASRRYLSFGPDTLAEARNRGYRAYVGPGANPA